MFPAETYVIESDLTHHYGLIKKKFNIPIKHTIETI